MNAPSKIELDTEDSWQLSKAYSEIFNPIPGTISAAITSLWQDHLKQLQQPGAEISFSSLQAVRRLEKTSKLKTPLYFAATSLFPERFEEVSEDDSSKALIIVLSPGVFASFLALIYIYKRLAKICENADWSTFQKEYVINMEFSFLVGSSFSKLGPALGALIGGMRMAALASMFLRNPDRYQRYRNAKKKRYDLEYEHEFWGCNHTQIAAFLLKSLGFRKDVFDLAKALRGVPALSANLSPDLQIWGAGSFLIESAREGNMRIDDALCLKLFSPSAEELEDFNTKCTALFQGNSCFGWMFKKSQNSSEADGEAPQE